MKMMNLQDTLIISGKTVLTASLGWVGVTGISFAVFIPFLWQYHLFKALDTLITTHYFSGELIAFSGYLLFTALIQYYIVNKSIKTGKRFKLFLTALLSNIIVTIGIGVVTSLWNNNIIFRFSPRSYYEWMAMPVTFAGCFLMIYIILKQLILKLLKCDNTEQLSNIVWFAVFKSYIYPLLILFLIFYTIRLFF